MGEFTTAAAPWEGLRDDYDAEMGPGCEVQAVRLPDLASNRGRPRC
jgi:hypothetical protein